LGSALKLLRFRLSAAVYFSGSDVNRLSKLFDEDIYLLVSLSVTD